ncbi:hypothetical protein HMF3257_39175 [Spirosoma telluris]|uniref:Uncharacterized protein n=1 Tax=Spirosoma telluris TaxID=2183553 RepID=A0A327NG46_9BACT|nr:hypothetical protein HMF3257_39175 [Spirosoma telluris]
MIFDRANLSTVKLTELNDLGKSLYKKYIKLFKKNNQSLFFVDKKEKIDYILPIMLEDEIVVFLMKY